MMKMISKPVAYWAMLRHWSAMAKGQSYWHLPQVEGTQFVPGTLEGYFNDLTGKTAWSGATDSHGVPLVSVNGQLQYFPVTVMQKGLGHWDLWLRSRRTDSVQWNQFERAVHWVLATQDLRGGWQFPGAGRAAVSPYSAMSQGQGISLLCRAYSTNQGSEYIAAAIKAAQLMLVPEVAGGTAHFAPEGIVLEETPLCQRKTILNGWIFALYGLYDLGFVVDSKRFRVALLSTVTALAAMLPIFDAGFWSYYDSSGTLASPFYHRLHISQLRVLQKSFPELGPVFAAAADRFEGYRHRATDRARAIMIKGFQKLRNPPEVIVA